MRWHGGSATDGEEIAYERGRAGKRRRRRLFDLIWLGALAMAL